MADHAPRRAVKVKRLEGQFRLFDMSAKGGDPPVTPTGYKTKAAAQKAADQHNNPRRTTLRR